MGMGGKEMVGWDERDTRCGSVALVCEIQLYSRSCVCVSPSEMLPLYVKRKCEEM